MGISKSRVFVASVLLVSLVVINLVEANHEQGSTVSTVKNPLLDKIDCDGACSGRCRLSSRPRLCKRACGTCCSRCNCVPPGTAGNHELCPCYANQTTHGGKPKCP